MYDHLFDMTLASSYDPAFATANGGTAATAEAVLFAGIMTGNAYLNIHTTSFGGGEIRGFLAPTPLPAALPLFATGLGALGLPGWRRKRKGAAQLDPKTTDWNLGRPPRGGLFCF
jgi:hypothetical protein